MGASNRILLRLCKKFKFSDKRKTISQQIIIIVIEIRKIIYSYKISLYVYVFTYKIQAFFMYPFCYDAIKLFFHRIVPNTSLSVNTSPDFKNFDFKGLKSVKKKLIKKAGCFIKSYKKIK